MATQFGTRPTSLGSHGIKQTLFDTLFNKQRCAIATTCNKLPESSKSTKCKTHTIYVAKLEHMHLVFLVCVCVCVRLFSLVLLMFLHLSSMVLTDLEPTIKETLLHGRRALPPRSRKQDVAAYPLCH